MARNRLLAVIDRFTSQVETAGRLIAAASDWHSIRKGHSARPISRTYFESVVELSYMKGYLAWERFVEESFVLFLLGQTARVRSKPTRFVFPQNRKHAVELILQGQEFIDWTSAEDIKQRAYLFFKSGRPFAKPISAITHQLRNMKTIRNAIAHGSGQSREKFKGLVRGKLAYYPTSLTVGGFLYRPVPQTSPPQMFFDYYFDSLLDAAKGIVA